MYQLLSTYKLSLAISLKYRPRLCQFKKKYYNCACRLILEKLYCGVRLKKQLKFSLQAYKQNET